MKNLEQIRALKALDTAPKTNKTAVSRLPAMILTNGLLASAAFASETNKDGNKPRRPAMKEAMDGTAQHLGHQSVGILVLTGCQDTAGLLKKLSEADSFHLQRATTEALAFLGFVKRFTTKEGSEENGGD